jgi:hypothetical protein
VAVPVPSDRLTMATTIQNIIDYSLTYIQYSPLAVGTGNQPAIGIANENQFLITSAPFTWGWNRNETGPTNNPQSTTPGVQDYVFPITDFGFLEKVSLADPNGKVFEVLNVYNTAALAIADTSVNKRARPESAAVISVNYGTSFKLRFIAVPDQVYQINLTYQKLVVPMTTLTGPTGTWIIPDQYQDIYANLFLADALSVVDDVREAAYRQRGVTALLSKAEGLDDMTKNAFLDMYWSRHGRPDLGGPLRTQQGVQSRGV